MISREEAIKILEIKRECVDYEGYSCSMDLKTEIEGARGCNLCDKAIDMAIEALSTERPKGRWVGEVIHTEIGEEHAMQECSHCGKVRIIDNFCPNCGADMRDGEEE